MTENNYYFELNQFSTKKQNTKSIFTTIKKQFSTNNKNIKNSKNFEKKSKKVLPRGGPPRPLGAPPRPPRAPGGAPKPPLMPYEHAKKTQFLIFIRYEQPSLFFVQIEKKIGLLACHRYHVDRMIAAQLHCHLQTIEEFSKNFNFESQIQTVCASHCSVTAAARRHSTNVL